MTSATVNWGIYIRPYVLYCEATVEDLLQSLRTRPPGVTPSSSDWKDAPPSYGTVHAHLHPCAPHLVSFELTMVPGILDSAPLSSSFSPKTAERAGSPPLPFSSTLPPSTSLEATSTLFNPEEEMNSEAMNRFEKRQPLYAGEEGGPLKPTRASLESLPKDFDTALQDYVFSCRQTAPLPLHAPFHPAYSFFDSSTSPSPLGPKEPPLVLTEASIKKSSLALHYSVTEQLLGAGEGSSGQEGLNASPFHHVIEAALMALPTGKKGIFVMHVDELVWNRVAQAREGYEKPKTAPYSVKTSRVGASRCTSSASGAAPIHSGSFMHLSLSRPVESSSIHSPSVGIAPRVEYSDFDKVSSSLTRPKLDTEPGSLRFWPLSQSKGRKSASPSPPAAAACPRVLVCSVWMKDRVPLRNPSWASLRYLSPPVRTRIGGGNGGAARGRDRYLFSSFQLPTSTRLTEPVRSLFTSGKEAVPVDGSTFATAGWFHNAERLRERGGTHASLFALWSETNLCQPSHHHTVSIWMWSGDAPVPKGFTRPRHFSLHSPLSIAIETQCFLSPSAVNCSELEAKDAWTERVKSGLQLALRYVYRPMRASPPRTLSRESEPGLLHPPISSGLSLSGIAPLDKEELAVEQPPTAAEVDAVECGDEGFDGTVDASMAMAMLMAIQWEVSVRNIEGEVAGGREGSSLTPATTPTTPPSSSSLPLLLSLQPRTTAKDTTAAAAASKSVSASSFDPLFIAFRSHYTSHPHLGGPRMALSISGVHPLSRSLVEYSIPPKPAEPSRRSSSSAAGGGAAPFSRHVRSQTTPPVGGVNKTLSYDRDATHADPSPPPVKRETAVHLRSVSQPYGFFPQGIAGVIHAVREDGSERQPPSPLPSPRQNDRVPSITHRLTGDKSHSYRSTQEKEEETTAAAASSSTPLPPLPVGTLRLPVWLDTALHGIPFHSLAVLFVTSPPVPPALLHPSSSTTLAFAGVSRVRTFPLSMLWDRDYFSGSDEADGVWVAIKMHAIRSEAVELLLDAASKADVQSHFCAFWSAEYNVTAPSPFSPTGSMTRGIGSRELLEGGQRSAGMGAPPRSSLRVGASKMLRPETPAAPSLGHPNAGIPLLDCLAAAPPSAGRAGDVKKVRTPTMGGGELWPSTALPEGDRFAQWCAWIAPLCSSVGASSAMVFTAPRRMPEQSFRVTLQEFHDASPPLSALYSVDGPVKAGPAAATHRLTALSSPLGLSPPSDVQKTIAFVEEPQQSSASASLESTFLYRGGSDALRGPSSLSFASVGIPFVYRGLKKPAFFVEHPSASLAYVERSIHDAAALLAFFELHVGLPKDAENGMKWCRESLREQLRSLVPTAALQAGVHRLPVLLECEGALDEEEIEVTVAAEKAPSRHRPSESRHVDPNASAFSSGSAAGGLVDLRWIPLPSLEALARSALLLPLPHPLDPCSLGYCCDRSEAESANSRRSPSPSPGRKKHLPIYPLPAHAAVLSRVLHAVLQRVFQGIVLLTCHVDESRAAPSLMLGAGIEKRMREGPEEEKEGFYPLQGLISLLRDADETFKHSPDSDPLTDPAELQKEGLLQRRYGLLGTCFAFAAMTLEVWGERFCLSRQVYEFATAALAYLPHHPSLWWLRARAALRMGHAQWARDDMETAVTMNALIVDRSKQPVDLHIAAQTEAGEVVQAAIKRGVVLEKSCKTASGVASRIKRHRL